MNIEKIDREKLKGYFVKNAVPTERNFSELIDAGLNQKDDGIAKLPSEPLSIEATGDDSSQQRVLNFYRRFSDAAPTWAMSLNPRTDPAKPETAKRGFGIGRPSDPPSLFIDGGSGDIGIGTNTPVATLHVVGGQPAEVAAGGYLVLGDRGADNLALDNHKIMARRGNTPSVLHLQPAGGDVMVNARQATSFVVKSGKVGIGTTAPAAPLHIARGTDVEPASGGFLVIGNPAAASIGIDDNEIMARSANNVSTLHLQGNGGDLAIHSKAPASSRFVVKGNGSVGIGTDAPADKLNVQDGDIRIAGGQYRRLKIISDTYWAGIELVAREKGQAGNPHIDFTHGDLDAPNYGVRLYAPTNDLLAVQGAVFQVEKLRLGNKWVMSGVGDNHGNDNWLRLFNTAGTDYYGGLAAGTLWTRNGQVQGSDERLKKGIRTIGDALSRLSALRGVLFRWRDPQREVGQQIGLLAQEVEAVFPELVETGPDGMKALNYSGLIAPIIEAIKEQRHQIESLTGEVERLRSASPPT